MIIFLPVRNGALAVVFIYTPACMCACVFVLCVNSKMMEVCGEAENQLASELMQHELQIESNILEPLNQLAEVKHRHWPDTSYCPCG